MLGFLGDIKGLFQACPEFPECGPNTVCCGNKRKEKMRIEAEAKAAAMRPSGANVLESLGVPEQYRQYVTWGLVGVGGLVVLRFLMK